MCPKWESEQHQNKPHGWSLPLKELSKVENNYFQPVLECIVCGYNFSLQEGVKKAFSSDIPFIIHNFQYNARDSGKVEIVIGQLKTIVFSHPFEDVPHVYLTPFEKPVNVVPGRVTNVEFSIFSCDSGTLGEMREITWIAYGNRAYNAIPIWRKLLSSSKAHQLRKDFRSELVDLESAFEVFIGEYLGMTLKNKLKDETINWILKLSIEEQLKIGFIELKGKALNELEPEAYRKWQKNVKETRDKVVHKGIFITEEEARNAREAVFDLITKIDSLALDHFQVEIEEVRPDNPNITFGTATIKAKS
jgi:hypothetical protein